KIANNTIPKELWFATHLVRQQTGGNPSGGALLLEVLPSGYVHRVVVGDAAEWQMNESTWKFSNSTVLDVSPVGNSSHPSEVDGFRVPSTPLTSGRALWKRTLDELPRNEIVGEINRLATRRRLEDKEPHANKTRNRVIDEDMLNKLEYFLYQRDAAAFSCVIYGLMCFSADWRNSNPCSVWEGLKVSKPCNAVCMGNFGQSNLQHCRCYNSCCRLRKSLESMAKRLPPTFVRIKHLF
ncbi:hypothetical protein KC19_8G052200, partial [Ceratodon purpureus]